MSISLCNTFVGSFLWGLGGGAPNAARMRFIINSNNLKIMKVQYTPSSVVRESGATRKVHKPMLKVARGNGIVEFECCQEKCITKLEVHKQLDSC